MSFNNDELNRLCITKLKKKNKKYYDKWLALRNHYAKVWFKEGNIKHTLYTPHNYNDHSVQMYRIVDDLITSANLWENIDEENLFCLDVAILFHDIGMYYYPDERYQHSIKANELLDEFYRDPLSVLHDSLNDIQFYCIKDLIQWHCDTKDKDYTIIEECSLENIELATRQGAFKALDEYLLLGLLRLADELDIVSDRVHDSIKNIGSLNPDKPEELYSIEQWKKCSSLTWPVIDAKNRKITIVPIKEVFGELPGDEFGYRINLIMEVYNKLSDELRKINDKCFTRSQALQATVYSKIEIDESDKRIHEALEAYRNKKSSGDTNWGIRVKTDVNITLSDNEEGIIQNNLGDTEDAETEESTDDIENAKTEESIDGIENAKTEESIDDTENAETEESLDGTENAKTEESIADTENAETEESIDGTENAETAESIVDTENAETAESIVDTENAERKEDKAATSENDAEKENDLNSYDNVEVLHPELSQQIVREVIKDKLIKNGHFKLSDEIHIRDWIDTQKIIENTELMEDIYNEFAKKAQFISDDDTLIVGIDFQGGVIASTIGIKIARPFSYIIPKRKEEDYVERERELISHIKPKNHIKLKKFIIITDCIITGNTVNEAIEVIKDVFEVTDESIIGIYCIILRKIDCKFYLNKKLMCKVIAATKDLDVTRCTKKINECQIAKYCEIHHENIIYD